MQGDARHHCGVDGCTKSKAKCQAHWIICTGIDNDQLKHIPTRVQVDDKCGMRMGNGEKCPMKHNRYKGLICD
ncbi:hypothetical protein PsYK624_128240 [Phanerochaete sordida]|uniref:Uncharacterized protein n=1 Tax=Phanerochaete sordida TaxID=48140 RepID=A0A9P3LJF6_9APHY|nr:hypothetical protein PsYK624_128240 [Phanerochaete sordida]